MQLPFTSSSGGASRTSLHNAFQLGKNRSRTELSMNEEADDGVARKSRPKSSALSGLLRGLGSMRMPRRMDRTLQTIRPASKRSFDDAAAERIVGRSKDMSATSEDLLIQQEIRTQPRLRTQASLPTNEHYRSQEHRSGKPLTTSEAQPTFIGAPYFNICQDQYGRRPHVIFVDQSSKMYSPATTDCRPVEHASFKASCIACEDLSTANHLSERILTTLSDEPNMLSFQGSEPGTIGFGYFLQLAFDHSDPSLQSPNFKNRRLLSLNPAQIGIRELNTDANIDRLAELGTLRQQHHEQQRAPATRSEEQVAKLGRHLFATLLYPFTHEDGDNLKSQIEALQEVLALPGLWHDFSLPDTRLRLGQLLWSAPQSPRRPSYEEKFLEPDDREVILWQITLASELLIRLDLIQSMSARKGSSRLISQSDYAALENSRSIKVDWDLVLAERFLDNLVLSARIPNKTVKNGLFSRVPYLVTREGPQPFYEPRHATNQICGLVRFAQALKWPTATTLEQELMSILIQPDEELQAALAEDQALEQHDLNLKRKPSGFTGDLEYSSRNEKAQRFLGISRRPSRPNTSRNEPDETMDFGILNNLQTMQLHPRLTVDADGGETDMGGWMSQSWLSGLVLPGEASSHFLIGSLLENTPEAIEVLGEEANLTGGFAYKGRSYWSKHCIVGRVLAAVRGARECMGWLAVPEVPGGQKDGWFQVDSEDPPYPNVRGPEDIGSASNPLGTSDSATTQDDFIYPTEGSSAKDNQVQSHGLTLRNTKRKTTRGGLTASIAFSSLANSKLPSIEVELLHNIHFVSAYPCYPHDPDAAQKILASEEDFDAMFAPSFTAEEIPKDRARLSRPMLEPSGTAWISDDPPGPSLVHALHVDYQFETIQVGALLSGFPEHGPRLRRTGATQAGGKTIDRVVVLDCRGSKDLQLLGRAWCAQMGEHAIVAKTGRTCISCSIREAYALAIAVIIRI